MLFQTEFYVFYIYTRTLRWYSLLKLGIICIKSVTQFLNVQLDEFLYRNLLVDSIKFCLFSFHILFHFISFHFLETGFHHLSQDGLDLRTSWSTFWSAGIRGVSHYTGPITENFNCSKRYFSLSMKWLYILWSFIIWNVQWRILYLKKNPHTCQI